MFVDAHVHGVCFRIRERFLRAGMAAVFGDCSPDDMTQSMGSLLADMERAGVDASIVITSSNLNLFEEYSRVHPNKLFVGYLYDSRDPKEGLRALRRAVDTYPRVIKCVKTLFPYLGQHPLQKEFQPLYRYCEKRRLPIQFHMGGDSRMEELSNPLYFGKLSSLFPKLTIVCLHAGGGMFQSTPLLLNLWPNLFVELEGLQLNEAEGSRQPNVLRNLLRKVDSSRLMFGSDRIFPEDKYFWRVEAARSVAREHVENLCWKTANRVFDLGLDKKKARSKATTAGAGIPERKKAPTTRLLQLRTIRDF